MARAPAYVITCSVPLDAPCDLLLAVVTGTKYLTRSLCVEIPQPFYHSTKRSQTKLQTIPTLALLTGLPWTMRV